MADTLTEVLESAFAAHAQAAQGVAAPGVGYVPTTFGPSNIPAQYVRGLGESAKNLLTGPGDIASGVREEGDWAPSMTLAMTGGGLGAAEDASLGSLALIPRKINAFGGAEGGAAAHGFGSLEEELAHILRPSMLEEVHGTVSNADVPQPSPLGYYSKKSYGIHTPTWWQKAGGTYAGKTQGGYSYSSAAHKDFPSSANDYFIHDEKGSKIGSMSYIPEEMTENSSTPAHWFMNLRNVPDLADKNYTAEELSTALEHAKLWNERGLAQKKPGLSDEELNAQLAKNPGASIFDIAGTKAPAGPASYKGYALHESGEPGDYFVHDPGGNEVAQITKKGKSYSIDMNDGSNSSAQSPLEALQKAQLLHQNVPAAPAKPEVDYTSALGPLNWESMTHNYAPASFEDIQTRERARQLGFNVDNPLFKGGRLTNYPENLYIPNKSYERGFFLADNPDIAQGYVRPPARSPMEYVARAERPMTVDWPSATGQSDYQESHMHALIEAARAKGADLLHIGNIRDVGGKQDQYVVLDPSIVRAPSAAFDPTRLKEAAPLAGLAGLSAGGLFFDENGNMKVAQ